MSPVDLRFHEEKKKGCWGTRCSPHYSQLPRQGDLSQKLQISRVHWCYFTCQIQPSAKVFNPEPGIQLDQSQLLAKLLSLSPASFTCSPGWEALLLIAFFNEPCIWRSPDMQKSDHLSSYSRWPTQMACLGRGGICITVLGRGSEDSMQQEEHLGGSSYLCYLPGYHHLAMVSSGTREPAASISNNSRDCYLGGWG